MSGLKEGINWVSVDFGMDLYWYGLVGCYGGESGQGIEKQVDRWVYCGVQSYINTHSQYIAIVGTQVGIDNMQGQEYTSCFSHQHHLAMVFSFCYNG